MHKATRPTPTNMKNRNKFFDFLGLLLILALLVPSMAAPKRKWFTWKRAIIAICVGLLAWQIVDTIVEQNSDPKEMPPGACVPATLHRIFPDTSLRKIMRLCSYNEQGTFMTNVPVAWRALSTNALVKKYDVFSTDTNGVDMTLMFGKPYLWIGNYEGAGHCALVSFSETNVLMSHSQCYTNTTNYFVVEMDYRMFFGTTWIILDAPELNKSIRMR
jgi:hypothetical protein